MIERPFLGDNRFLQYGRVLAESDPELANVPSGPESYHYIPRRTRDAEPPCNIDAVDEFQFDLGYIPLLGLYQDEVDALIMLLPPRPDSDLFEVPPPSLLRLKSLLEIE